MGDSLTLTLTGTTSVLETQFYPPIELSSSKNYVLGLIELLTFNSIPNIDVDHNKFYVDEEIITLPTGSYEIEDIEKYLQEAIPKGIELSIKPNTNTLTCEIECSHPIDFQPNDSIASVLGFTKRIIPANTFQRSNLPVAILKVNALRVECSITTGAYINGQKVHTIHEFFPAVPPGYKIIEIPTQVIYLPISVKSIDHLELRIVDQDGALVNFRGEIITVRLHIKSL